MCGPMKGASATLEVEVLRYFTYARVRKHHRESTTYVICKQYVAAKRVNEFVGRSDRILSPTVI